MKHAFAKEFLLFAETKDPFEDYQYGDATRCACAQFAETLGELEYQTYVTECPGNCAEGTKWELIEEAAAQYPRDWGALTRRLRRTLEA